MIEPTKWRVVGWFFALSAILVIPMLPEQPDEPLRQAACLIMASICFATSAILRAISELASPPIPKP